MAAKGTVGLGVEACGHAAGSLSDEHAAVRLDEADLDNRRNPVARRTAIIRSRCRWRRYDSSSATHANSGPVTPGFHSIPADARFVKVPYPNAFPSGAAAGPEARPLFCVLVSSNKALMVHDERDLYGERVRIIDWYEANAPGDFHLYGKGWEVRASRPGRIGRLLGKFA